MQKSNEERLADIESGITRLVRTQGYVLRSLFILHKQSVSFTRSERSLTQFKESLESAHQRMDRSLVLMFGAITMMGVAASMVALYYATQRSSYIVVSIVSFISVFVLIFFGVLESRRSDKQLQAAEQKLTQTENVVDRVGEEIAASNKELAEIVAEWKELTAVPDDLASEPKSED